MKVTVRGALAAGFILGMCALCVRLGFWQLDRLQQRREGNAALASRMRLPPLTVDAETADSIRRDSAAFVNRRVRASGVYLPGDVVLRGRAHEGRPGVHLVTPLAVGAGGEVILVNRGWVLSPDAVTVDAARHAEPGERAVEGILQQVPVTRDGGAPSSGGGRTTYRRLDLPTLRRTIGRPVLPLYVQQLPEAGPAPPAGLVRIPLPSPGEGPHLGYAIQWFSFAAIGIVGLAILVFRRRDAAAP
ncbi:MAG TPA: SURF1 family protein [Longimicrobiaceae bacterium]|nr:SURF1 family protein [Longimicrobiaceae bacterium]